MGEGGLEFTDADLEGFLELDVEPCLLEQVATALGGVEREVEGDLVEGLSGETEDGVGDGEAGVGDVVLVVGLVEAFVVIPVEVAARLDEHVGLEDEVALLGLDGESLASGEGNDAVVGVEVNGGIFHATVRGVGA